MQPSRLCLQSVGRRSPFSDDGDQVDIIDRRIFLSSIHYLQLKSTDLCLTSGLPKVANQNLTMAKNVIDVGN